MPVGPERVSNDLLDKLIWVFIYGGLLAFGTGLAAARAPAWVTSVLVWGGALAVAIGLVLIWVRSRRSDRP
jgi:hypothetical protein